MSFSFLFYFFEASDSTGEGLTRTYSDTFGKELGFELKWPTRKEYGRLYKIDYLKKRCHSFLYYRDIKDINFLFYWTRTFYTFFTSSTKRWGEVLKKHVSQLTLKPPNATRRSSRKDA